MSNEDVFAEEIIETVTPTPEEIENMTVQQMEISNYNLSGAAFVGLGTGGAVVIFSLGVGVLIRLFKRM